MLSPRDLNGHKTNTVQFHKADKYLRLHGDEKSVKIFTKKLSKKKFSE